MENLESLGLYERLGLKKDCSARDIRKSYLHQAKRYHPDKTQKDTNNDFSLIDEAYCVLSNPELKTAYDKHCNSRQNQIRSGIFHYDTTSTESFMGKHNHVTIHGCTVKPHSQSVSVSIHDAEQWITVCEQFYKSSGFDRGSNGIQFKTDFLDGDRNLGSLSITIYKSTKNMHVQGSCYLLWLVECYNDLLELALADNNSNGEAGTQIRLASTRSAAQNARVLITACTVADKHATSNRHHHGDNSKITPTISLPENHHGDHTKTTPTVDKGLPVPPKSVTGGDSDQTVGNLTPVVKDNVPTQPVTTVNDIREIHTPLSSRESHSEYESTSENENAIRSTPRPKNPRTHKGSPNKKRVSPNKALANHQINTISLLEDKYIGLVDLIEEFKNDTNSQLKAVSTKLGSFDKSTNINASLKKDNEDLKKKVETLMKRVKQCEDEIKGLKESCKATKISSIASISLPATPTIAASRSAASSSIPEQPNKTGPPAIKAPDNGKTTKGGQAGAKNTRNPAQRSIVAPDITLKNRFQPIANTGASNQRSTSSAPKRQEDRRNQDTPVDVLVITDESISKLDAHKMYRNGRKRATVHHLQHGKDIPEVINYITQSKGKPDFVVISVGGNDVTAHDKPLVKQQLDSLGCVLEDKWSDTKVVFVPLLPKLCSGMSRRDASVRTQEMNTMINHMCSKHHNFTITSRDALDDPDNYSDGCLSDRGMANCAALIKDCIVNVSKTKTNKKPVVENSTDIVKEMLNLIRKHNISP